MDSNLNIGRPRIWISEGLKFRYRKASNFNIGRPRIWIPEGLYFGYRKASNLDIGGLKFGYRTARICISEGHERGYRKEANLAFRHRNLRLSGATVKVVPSIEVSCKYAPIWTGLGEASPAVALRLGTLPYARVSLEPFVTT
ncbi:hypothetical protein Tcan_13629 [Toxocara canis]|uniref:Uncharacterized protein n=1 Tax=Toxocara canis TaxID=6265 RepID=A0A0B2VR67_TOXCA|nr:hypothetical protein Tcan_13629 [Toxocara canis]